MIGWIEFLGAMLRGMVEDLTPSIPLPRRGRGKTQSFSSLSRKRPEKGPPLPLQGGQGSRPHGSDRLGGGLGEGSALLRPLRILRVPAVCPVLPDPPDRREDRSDFMLDKALRVAYYAY